jgi:hypothetical protein
MSTATEQIAAFNRERDEALTSLDEHRIRAFFRKWNGKELPDEPLVFWGAIHKAITGATSILFETRLKSYEWLASRGFQSWDDGDLKAAYEKRCHETTQPFRREEPQVEPEGGHPPGSAPATGSPNAQGVDGKTASSPLAQEADTQRLTPPQAEGRPERPEGARWGSDQTEARR